MIGVFAALLGVLLVLTVALTAKLRVRSVFGVYDDWSLNLAQQTAVLPSWLNQLKWSGWVAVAFGLAMFVAS